MFVFLLILLTTIIFALPVTKKSLYIKETTIVPEDISEKSSNYLHESVNTLQSAINIIFPKNDEYERNFSIDQQSLLIGCLIKIVETTEEQQRACKGLHENNDKNLYYEFEDKPLEQNDTDYLPRHVEHINVVRIKTNKEKLKNDQKLNEIRNRLINNRTNKIKMNFDSKFNFSSIQNSFYSSTPLDISLNRMDVNKYTNNTRGGLFLSSSSNNDSIEAVKQVPQYYSSYSINEETDHDYDSDFEIDRIFPRLNKKKVFLYNQKKPSSFLNEEYIIEENTDDNYEKFDTNTDNETDISFIINNNNSKKLEQENKSSNESITDTWSISRFSNDPIPKNVLLTDLTKALETLETVVDRNDSDAHGDQISFKPADLRSIIKSQKFSEKFLQFLNIIKSTVEQLNLNNKTNLIN